MPIERDFITSLIERTDLVQLVHELWPLKRQGSEFAACCPFHHEGTPSFTVSPKKQFFYCFGCRAHGNAIDFLVKFQGVDFRSAVEQLAIRAGVQLPEGWQSAEGRVWKAKKAWFEEAQRVNTKLVSIYQGQLRSHPDAKEARRYLLQERGLTPETLLHYRVGFSLGKGLEKHFSETEQQLLTRLGIFSEARIGRENHERFQRRVLFPIQDERRQWVGFGGRALSSEQLPKYLNSQESDLFKKGYLLYGLSEAKSSSSAVQRGLPSGAVLLVEGYLDVLTCHQAGYTAVVAALGTSLSDVQLTKLFRNFESIWVAYDADSAGIRATEALLEKALGFLKPGKALFFVALPEGYDPAELIQKEGKAAFQAALDAALPLSCKIFEAAPKSLTYAEGRVEFFRKLRSRIEQIPDLDLRAELQNIGRGYFQNEDGNWEAEAEQPAQGHGERQEVQTVEGDPVVAALPRSRSLRIALSLLLQHPELLKGIQLEPVVDRWLPEDLKALLRRMQADPEVFMQSTLAQRIARFQGEKHHKLFKALAVWEHLIRPEKRAEVLKQSFQNLAERHCDGTLKHYLTLAKQRPLKSEEVDFYWKTLQELQALKRSQLSQALETDIDFSPLEKEGKP